MTPRHAAADAPGAPLDRIAAALGAVLVPVSAPAATIGDVVIAEPGDDLTGLAGVLVLVVGARGAEAAGQVRAAAAGGAAAVAVRMGTEGVPTAVRAAAERTGTALLGIPAGVRWDRVESEARRELVRAAGAGGPDRPGDLFSLAQTLVTLTHGLVSIEDNAHRVLAYAGDGDHADELRSRSILGRSCPESHLALLRRWGVYQRLRTCEETVEVEPHPDLGMHRRLAVGVHAGTRPLGTIWVQEGGRPLAAGSGEALRGAARLAAAQLVDHYYQGDAAVRLHSREDLAHGLLTGRFNAAALGAHLGLAQTDGVRVVAVDLRDEAQDDDVARRDARLAEAAGIVAVHAAAHRRNALVAQACGQIYAMLPEPPVPAAADDLSWDAAEQPLVRWATEVVTALRRHTGTPVQAVVAGTAARLDGIPAVKLRGHHGLRTLARTPDRLVATHTGLTASLLVHEMLDLRDRHGGIRHPGLEALVAHDSEHGTELARSLLLYLDAFGDVGAVAETLTVHPNTLRYRVRRAAALAGLDLGDPEHRLAAMIQLRGATREPQAAPYFPH